MLEQPEASNQTTKDLMYKTFRNLSDVALLELQGALLGEATTPQTSALLHRRSADDLRLMRRIVDDIVKERVGGHQIVDGKLINPDTKYRIQT